MRSGRQKRCLFAKRFEAVTGTRFHFRENETEENDYIYEMGCG